MKISARTTISFATILFVIYSLVWFAGAHIIKKQIQNTLCGISSEHLKLTYKDIEISGYPFKWSINIYDINSSRLEIDNVAQIKVINTRIDLNLLLKSLEITFSDPINFTLGSSFDSLTKYTLTPQLPIQIITTFNKPLYFMLWQQNLTLKDLFHSTNIIASNIEIFKNDMHNTSLNNFSISSIQMPVTNKIDVNIKFGTQSSKPQSLLQDTNFHANLKIDLALSGSKTIFIRALEVTDLLSQINTSSELKLSGNINFNDPSSQPTGSFNLAFKNYPELAEILSLKLKRYFEPEELKLKIINIIFKASVGDLPPPGEQLGSGIFAHPNTISSDAVFDITFTENGIKIGEKDLNDFSDYKDEF
jgi:hypothetical protein